MGKPSVDWDYWRHRYVSGDNSVSLGSLSKLPNAPTFASLKRESALRGWTEQRRKLREETHTRMTSAIALDLAEGRSEHLVDVVAMIERHNLLAGKMLELSKKWLDNCNPLKLKASDVVQMVKLGAELERLSAGMATEHLQVSGELMPSRIEIVALSAQKVIDAVAEPQLD